MIFHYTLSEAEYVAIDKKLRAQIWSRTWLFRIIQSIGALFWLVLAAVFIFATTFFSGASASAVTSMQALILFVAGVAIVIKLLQDSAYRHLIVDCSHLLHQQWTVTVTDDSISFNATRSSIACRWQGVHSVVEVEGTVAIFFSQTAYMPMASSAFVDQAIRNEFLQFAAARIALAHDLPQVPIEVISTPASPTEDLSVQIVMPRETEIETTPRWQNAKWLLTQNIVNAFKLALGIRVPLVELPVMWWQCVAFPFLSVLALFLQSYVAIGVDGEFNRWALSGVLYPIPIYLIAAIVTAYVVRQPEKSLAAFQLLLMMAFAIDAFVLAVMLLPAADLLARHATIFVGSLPIFLSTLWLGIVSMVAMSRLFNSNVVPIITAIALIIAPLAIGFRNDDLWGQSQATLAANYKAYSQNQVTNEDNFYKQPTLLADALAAITPQREGVTELFFIGFAGDGHQNVFRREVDAVATLMQERFDTVGHTIKLINNVDTVGAEPIASLTSLQAALKKIATSMDIEEDVLVLFLTSHGSEDHQFSLTLAGMQFKTLEPSALRRSLDDSGIKNRVVIISACYSGGFVDALKNENTLVITAAAPDRKSFGCSNTSEWTYFGKAYFDEALRQTTSFTKAFDIALPIVAAREASEGYTKSQPMMVQGEAIGAKLAATEKQLEKKLVLK